VQWLSALLTPIIGLLAVYIAYQQWRTANSKLNLDLFDKRLVVYNAAMTFATSIVTNGAVAREDIVHFSRETRDSEFLFDTIIRERLMQLRKEAMRLQLAEQTRSGPAPEGEMQKTIASKWEQILPWFDSQIGELPKMFGPYLRVHTPPVWERLALAYRSLTNRLPPQ
jgi:hypothetical protein